jgi:hypothetical protein
MFANAATTVARMRPSSSGGNTFEIIENNMHNSMPISVANHRHFLCLRNHQAASPTDRRSYQIRLRPSPRHHRCFAWHSRYARARPIGDGNGAALLAASTRKPRAARICGPLITIAAPFSFPRRFGWRGALANRLVNPVHRQAR